MNKLKRFWEEAIDENGEMNRQYVGEIVFNHPDLREALNEIVHPIVRDNGTREKQLSRTWISCNYGYPIVVRK